MLRCKAMESITSFMFSVWLLRKVLPRLRGDVHSTALGLLTASENLEEWYKILRASGPLPEPTACNHAVVLAKKHVTLWRHHSGQQPKPKHHAFVDLSRAMARTRNPKEFSTYPDETVNSMISRLAKTVHPRHFACAVLKKYYLQRSLKGLPW